MISRIGAWVDRRGVLADWRDWLGEAQRLGLTDVCLVLHGQDAGEPFRPFAPAERIARIATAYRAAGITPHGMVYPQPRHDHARALLAYIGEVQAAGAALAVIELDVEEQWTRSAWRLVRGQAVAQQLRQGWPKGTLLGVNGITAALPKIRPLVELADVVIPQAYTSTRPGQTSTPGARQDVVADAWRRVMRPGAELVMGLAAYSQEGAGGLPAAEALGRAYDACQDECSRVAYWSLADLTGGPDHHFVRGKCAALRSPPA